MTKLEIKKIEVELLRVQASKAELELRIEEAMDNIKKLEEHIQIQNKKEIEIKQKIKEMEK